MRLLFATNNNNKLFEINSMLKGEFEVVGMKEAGISKDIPEPCDTLKENAETKAKYIFEKLGCDCFGEDTGLEISALGGKPGVLSARFAGEQKNAEDNIAKALKLLKSKRNRQAQFRTVIALIKDGNTHFFEGIVKGKILDNKRGESGFGYDPIFQPEGYDQSFAEMDLEEKNKISHRGRALKKLVAFLKTKKKLGI